MTVNDSYAYLEKNHLMVSQVAYLSSRQ